MKLDRILKQNGKNWEIEKGIWEVNLAGIVKVIQEKLGVGVGEAKKKNYSKVFWAQRGISYK